MTSDFDIRAAFAAKQEVLLACLGLPGNFVTHPTFKGDATEAHWIQTLRDFLPARYGVGSAFVIDSSGKRSQQIDLAIYDRQYSPLFFTQKGIDVLPVESIYAVFEVKPTADLTHVEYAQEKIASVKSLQRTSVAITHAGGTFPPQDPDSKPILGGLLTTRSEWKPLDGVAARAGLLSDAGGCQLDFTIAVDSGAAERVGDILEYAPEGTQLIWFGLRLLRRLAAIGTVVALDLDAYARPLDYAD
ncbi:DUF6602 domain-containing protein [Demequina sp.]|uniref:DUF6602 domain-containing protein n=1 Tax=Demequina sp. TaxID=2050685 RepID=UPI003D0D4213